MFLSIFAYTSTTLTEGSKAELISRNKSSWLLRILAQVWMGFNLSFYPVTVGGCSAHIAYHCTQTWPYSNNKIYFTCREREGDLSESRATLHPARKQDINTRSLLTSGCTGGNALRGQSTPTTAPTRCAFIILISQNVTWKEPITPAPRSDMSVYFSRITRKVTPVCVIPWGRVGSARKGGGRPWVITWALHAKG